MLASWVDLKEGKSTFQAESIRKKLVTVMSSCSTIFVSHIFSLGVARGGGVVPTYKKDGNARGKFLKESLRETKVLFCGRCFNIFSPTNSKTATS